MRLSFTNLGISPPVNHQQPYNFSGTTTGKLDELMYRMRPMMANGLITHTNGFVFNQGSDKRWSAEVTGSRLKLPTENHSYFHTESESFHTFYPEFCKPWKIFYSPSQSLLLATSIPKFDATSWLLYTEKYWLPLVSLVLLIALYQLLKLTLTRLFGVGVFQFPEVIGIDDQPVTPKANTTAGWHQHHQFYISMPFADGTELCQLMKKNGTSCYPIDLSYALNDNEFQNTLANIKYRPKEERIVLKHFSYGIDDPDVNLRRLQLLEHLLAKELAVTIISKLTPMQITAKYEEVIDTTNDQAKKDELENRVACWKDILASFVKLYYSELVCNRKRKRLSHDSTVRELVHYEMGANRGYFTRLDGILLKAKIDKWNYDDPTSIELSDRLANSSPDKSNSTDEDIKEEIILKIQSMAQPFYFSLWNTCSKEEKYLLYDLSDDGFVNTKDKQVLLRLMEKGLIFYDESFHVMNESFRNFILTNIKPSESLAMEKELKNQGRWSTYSTIILLLVVSLVIFMVFAQDSVVNQFTALLAGMAAIVPYIIRLGGALVPNFNRNGE